MARDDFSTAAIRILAARAGYRCSNPGCRKPTSGPQDDPAKTINIGVAAHITAAAPGGPRYDPRLSAEERSAIDNAIWLCQSCAKLIDSDESRYGVQLLHAWKVDAEKAALDSLEGGEPSKPATGGDVVSGEVGQGAHHVATGRIFSRSAR
jgi:hypothetical protein